MSRKPFVDAVITGALVGTRDVLANIRVEDSAVVPAVLRLSLEVATALERKVVNAPSMFKDRDIHKPLSASPSSA